MGKHKKSKYAAKLDQRKRVSDIDAKADRKTNGGFLSSSYTPVSRPFVPTPQIPIEKYVRQVAEEKAERNGRRTARAERPEPPALNVRLANFAFITPGFIGLENETIEFAAHEFAPIPTDVETGSTYLHVRNTKDGWEIERHFDGGWRHHKFVTTLLPLEYTDKDGMIAKLESWVRDQNAKGLKKSINHMNDHLMAHIVSPKAEKPAPTQRSERVKQWSQAVAGVKKGPPGEDAYKHLVTPVFRNIEEKSFTLFGQEFPATRNDYGLSLGTYFSAIGSGDVWEIYRCLDTGLHGRESRTILKSMTKEDVIAELAGWVREQEYENNPSHTMHLGLRPEVELIKADSDGFKAPFLQAEKSKPDPRELTYG